MSSGDAGSGPRERLLEAAIRMLEESGPHALQARKLAAEVGTSTMAVYTHFGGMPQLFEAIVRDGFVRFGRCLGEVPRTDDPMSDFLEQGLAYRDYALHNSQLYRLMFGLTGTGRLSGTAPDMTETGTPARLGEDPTAFDHLVRALDRLQESGRISPVDSIAAAGQVWSLIHGYVLLEIAGYFGQEDHGLERVLGPLTINVLVGLGADRAAVERSALAVLAVRGSGSPR